MYVSETVVLEELRVKFWETCLRLVCLFWETCLFERQALSLGNRKSSRKRQLAKIASNQQKERRDNKQYTVEVRKGVFYQELQFLKTDLKYSHTKSFCQDRSVRKVIFARWSPLTVWAWARAMLTLIILGQVLQMNEIFNWIPLWKPL